MIGSFMGWIATVIGGNKQCVGIFHFREKRSQPLIKFNQSIPVTGNIPAVSVFHIKINQIGKNQPRFKSFHTFFGMMHAIQIGFVMNRKRNPLSAENIFNFPHTGYVISRVLQVI